MIPQLNTVTIGHLWRIFDPLIDPKEAIRGIKANFDPSISNLYQNKVFDAFENGAKYALASDHWI